MPSTRVYSMAAVAALALALTGCGGTTFEKDAPQTAVRDFLAEALVLQNGQRACDFLTSEAQGELADGNCRLAMETAGLKSDGEAVTGLGQIKAFGYDVTANDGESATVVVTPKGGEAIEITLRKDEGLGNLYEPRTPWRITGGVKPLTVTTSV